MIWLFLFFCNTLWIFLNRFQLCSEEFILVVSIYGILLFSLVYEAPFEWFSGYMKVRIVHALEIVDMIVFLCQLPAENST